MTTTRGQKKQDEQPPLGPEPSYEDVLDIAVEYTFPCSDPISVDSCCRKRKPPAPESPAT